MNLSRLVQSTLSALVVLAFLPSPAAPADGSSYETDALRSAEHLIAGLRAKRAASAMPGTPERRARYEQAAQELCLSVELSPSYGGLVALGEVYLELGRGREAMDNCSRALLFDPEGAEAAHNCVARSLDVPEPVPDRQGHSLERLCDQHQP